MSQLISKNTGFFILVIIIVLSAILVKPYLPVILDWLPLPKPTPTPQVWIEKIRALSELATVEYRTVAKVQNEQVPEDVRKWFGAKEQILMLVYSTVKAGFDLSALSENDVWVSGSQVQLVLPSPKILSIVIDNKRTHVVYYKKSLLVGHDLNLEGETRQLADEAIYREAVEAGILEQAAAYGKIFFENYLRSLGFSEIQVIVK